MLNYSDYGLDSVVYVDIETTGLNFLTDEITSISCIRFSGGVFKSYSDMSISQLTHVIKQSECVVAHNIKFDLKFIINASKNTPHSLTFADLNEKLLIDTMIICHYLNTETRLDLATLETLYLGRNTKEEFKTSFGENPSEYDSESLSRYNLNDVRITRDLFEVYIEDVPVDFLTLMSEYTKSLMHIEYHGINFDLKKAEELLDRLTTQIDISRNALFSYIETVLGTTYRHNLNLNSAKQLSKLLYTDLGIPKPQRENYPSGKGIDKLFTSTLTNKELLLDLNHEIIPLLLNYTKFMSLQEHVKSYVVLTQNGRLYPTFNTTTTVTGRLSCSKPNLQNISKEKSGFDLRGCFKADNNEILVSIDYKQQEIVSLACVSGDENLLALVKEGKDLHAAVGEKIFKRQITETERTMVKNIHFGLLYGLGIPVLSYKAKMSAEDTIDFLNEYYATFSRVKEWKDEITNEAKYTGKIKLFSDRVWYCNNPSLAYKAVNACIQGTSADITAIGVNRVSSFLRSNELGRVMSIIHDEILFSVKTRDCINELISILAVEDIFNVGFKTDVEYKY